MPAFRDAARFGPQGPSFVESKIVKNRRPTAAGLVHHVALMRTRLTATAVLTLAAWPLAAQAPVIHRLTPERFYNTFSFAHPPAFESSRAIA